MPRTAQYRLADSFQQAVGGFLLAGPFVVTQEVWELAVQMGWPQTVATVGIVFLIGYGALYKADSGRDPDREVELAGVPVRFLSLIAVSYLSVAVLALAFGAPRTFLEPTLGNRPVRLVGATLRAISVGAVFSVIGAATADSLF